MCGRNVDKTVVMVMSIHRNGFMMHKQRLISLMSSDNDEFHLVISCSYL